MAERGTFPVFSSGPAERFIIMTNVFDHWQAQKPALRAALEELTDPAGAAERVRHALLQTEQNALAEMTDEVLRQQAGVLMSQLKTSVDLVDCQASAQVWTPRRQADKPAARGGIALWGAALLVQLALGGYCYLKGLALGWLLALAALLAGVWALVRERRRPTAPEDEVRVVLKPDVERLLTLMDRQMRAIDRSLNDLAYLNEQLRGGLQTADAATLARAADLMEALYECDGEVPEAAGEAARKMLAVMGLTALDYTEENRRLFNALPSKSETRTLSPAIVSLEDRRLLRRGTAAVRTDAA